MTVSPQQLKLPHHVPSTGLRGQTKLLEPRPLFLQGCPSPLAPYRSKIYTCIYYYQTSLRCIVPSTFYLCKVRILTKMRGNLVCSRE